MNNFIFLAPNWLWLVILIPLWLMINLYHQRQSLLDLQNFRKVSLKKHKQYLHQALMLITLIALVLALAKPGWNPQPQSGETQGRDRVFLLDVSRSMLVQDARPNRLEVARQAIRNTIKSSNSDRFGLVVFAGSTSIQAPLTNDKSFFNYLLEQVNSDSVAQGGTRIEDALFKVLDKMSEKNQKNAMDIILISDGEDLGGQPERALTKLNELGARLIVIGLGDSEFGGRIPDRTGTGWQFYQGKEIWSRMDTVKLRNLAQGAEQGMFIPVGTATFDLAQIIEKLRQVWPSNKRKKGQMLTYHQGYPYCLFIALLAQIICWLRGSKAWLAGLVVLSFNSQAFENISLANNKPTEQISPSEKLVNTTPAFLEQLTPKAQFFLAESLFQDSPEQAVEVYRYIASQAQQSAIAVKANYNLATSLIHYAEALSQKLALPDDLTEQLNASFDDEQVMFDDDEFIDPEIYYSEASGILCTLLLHTPAHQASQQNLEWLMLRADARQNYSPPSSAQQQSAQQHEQESKQAKNSEQQTDQENKQASEQQSNESQQSQQSDASALQMANMQLPSPQDSAEYILQQAEERNLTERAPKSKKQSTVERDW